MESQAAKEILRYFWIDQMPLAISVRLVQRIWNVKKKFYIEFIKKDLERERERDNERENQ